MCVCGGVGRTGLEDKAGAFRLDAVCTQEYKDLCATRQMGWVDKGTSICTLVPGWE